jgi:regulator of protease activity HflC (stomatin/prohibitin superfamily)
MQAGACGKEDQMKSHTAMAKLGLVGWGIVASGCATVDVPPAHRGMRFEHTGLFRLYQDGHGFGTEVLDPGTHVIGVYTDLVLIDCSMVTMREPLTALTKDGVQFGIDLYIRFSIDCTDQSVRSILRIITPDTGNTVSSKRFYELFVRPEIGEAVRQTVSPFRANDLNERRDELLAGIQKRVVEGITAREKWINVHDVSLSNLDFPDAMDNANVDRAVQAVLRDKAIAERERVQAEIETTRLRRKLSESEGEAEAAKIDKIGEALRRNPQFLQFDLQSKMPQIYENAGAQGNLVIAAPSPQVLVQTPTRASAVAQKRPARNANSGLGRRPVAERPNPVLNDEK